MLPSGPPVEVRSVYTSQIEKGGPILRTLLAHGFLDTPSCYSIEGFYTWWLVLKMTLATSPAIRQALETTEPDAKEATAVNH